MKLWDVVQQMPLEVQVGGNVTAAAVAVSSWMAFLPAAASIASILWIILQAVILIINFVQKRKKDREKEKV